MNGPTDEPLVDQEPGSRSFAVERRVRWGDVDRFGRLRLDSFARYIQDLSNDDTRDSGLDPSAPWVVRRTVIDVIRPPALGEVLTLTTFCGGLGSRWAERRTTATGENGAQIEAAAVWISIDPVTGRPARLTPELLAVHQVVPARKVDARRRHPEPPDGLVTVSWPLRSTDHDPLGHVNNAATWEPIEAELDRRGLVPTRAELEYGDAIGPTDEVLVGVDDRSPTLRVWLTVDGNVRASAVVSATAR